MRPQSQEKEYATTAEARAAIVELPDAECAKLLLRAGYWVRQRHLQRHLEPEDLLQEATLRTLQGRRRWRKGVVALAKHLDETMRSVSGHLRASAPSDPVEIDEETEARDRSARETLADRDLIERALLNFRDDKAALAVLHLRAAGSTPSEIREEMGIGKTQYDTICKRIRRTVVKISVDD